MAALSYHTVTFILLLPYKYTVDTHKHDNGLESDI